MYRLSVVLSLFLATSQLSSQTKIDLTSDKSLTKVFNQSEIKGLESMIEFVDNMVLNKGNGTNINEAYHLYFEEIAQIPEYIVPFEETVKYPFLESLDSAVFATIWSFETSNQTIRLRDSVYRNLENFKTLNLRPYSKYMEYLREIGKNDPYFQSLHSELENVGDITIASSQWFPKNHMIFDFNIPKNRLWATIYLLRREETFEMKLYEYLKNK